MILNDIWARFNRLIQSNTSTDIDRKIDAINTAQLFLVQRMYELCKVPDDFISSPTNISNLISTNYIAQPSGLLALHTAWYRSGSQFIPFGRYAIISYDDLLQRAGQNFFDTTVTALPTLLAVKDPNIYFDQHFNNTFTDNETITGATSGATATVDSVSDTTLTYTIVSGSFSSGEVIEGSTSGTQATISDVTATTMTIAITGGTKEIKISYYKTPTDVEHYDTLTMDNVSGTFEVGESITGADSNATATVRSVTATTLTITNRTGTFQDNEVITGATSTATADVNGSVTLLNAPMDWNDKYKTLVSEAASLIWLHMKNSNNVPARADIVDGLIELYCTMNRSAIKSQWSVNT